MEVFEFVIAGPPISQQTNNRILLQAWKEQVRREAAKRWPRGVAPVTTPTMLTVVYFQDSPPMLIDNDNFAKPIADALNGLVYVDDRYVTDTKIRRTQRAGKVRIRSLVLASGFIFNRPFLYVKVEDAPDHREMP